MDDSADAQQLFRTMLERAGFDVFPAHDGREALGLLLDQPSPSLIIIDLIMPVMDGMELIDVLRSYTRLAQIPILVVSAVAVPPSGFLPGTRYHQKPFDENALLRDVMELVAQTMPDPGA